MLRLRSHFWRGFVAFVDTHTLVFVCNFSWTFLFLFLFLTVLV